MENVFQGNEAGKRIHATASALSCLQEPDKSPSRLKEFTADPNEGFGSASVRIFHGANLEEPIPEWRGFSAEPLDFEP